MCVCERKEIYILHNIYISLIHLFIYSQYILCIGWLEEWDGKIFHFVTFMIFHFALFEYISYRKK